MVCANGSSADSKSNKTVIFPLAYFGPSDSHSTAVEVQSGLARRLESKGIKVEVAGSDAQDMDTAIRAAQKAGADTIILGSVSRLGEQLSLDINTIDIKAPDKTPHAVYVFGESSQLTILLDSLEKKLETSQSSSETVMDVLVRGNRRIDADAITNVLSIKKGTAYSSATFGKDIKAIYDMGYFEDVQIDVSEKKEGKIITFFVREKPAIRQIKITGNNVLKENDIRDVLDLKKFAVIQNKALSENSKKIETLYEEKGYVDTVVTAKPTPISEKEADVVFEIKEGKKVAITSIEFNGNKAFSDSELKKLLETTEKKPFWYLNLKNIMATIKGEAGVLKSDALERDLGRISAYYHNNGYVDAVVGEPEIDKTNGAIVISIPIEEGERYGVGEISVEEKHFNDPSKVLAKMTIKEKPYFSQELLRKDVLSLTDLYADEGYAYADVNPVITKDKEKKLVNIKLKVNEGKVVRFERIDITGNVETRDKVIRRELRVNELDKFNATDLKKSKDRLKRLGFFEDVNLNPTKGTQEDTMKLDVQVKERPTGSFSIGAGYSSVDKLIFMGDITKRNFMGNGQTLGFKGIIGAVTNRFSLNFTDPYVFDTDWSFGTSIYNWEVSYDDYTKKSAGAELFFGYPLTDELKAYVGTRIDNTTLSDVADNASQIIKDSMEIKATRALNLKLVYDTRNDYYLPSKGWYNTLFAEYAGGFLGGDSGFYKFNGTASYYHPIWKELVGHIKAGAGYVVEGSDGKLPIYEKYFLGGIDSVRGFKSGRISPVDPKTNERIGGEYMAYTQMETIFPLIKDMGVHGVTFLDMGNVWGEDSGYQFSDLRKSIGLGIRWLSPMGPLRVEWGYNLDAKKDEDKSNWEFRMGGTF